MEGQLVVPGTDLEEPAKLTDREFLNMNKQKKKKKKLSSSADYWSTQDNVRFFKIQRDLNFK